MSEIVQCGTEVKNLKHDKADLHVGEEDHEVAFSYNTPSITNPPRPNYSSRTRLQSELPEAARHARNLTSPLVRITPLSPRLCPAGHQAFTRPSDVLSEASINSHRSAQRPEANRVSLDVDVNTGIRSRLASGAWPKPLCLHSYVPRSATVPVCPSFPLNVSSYQ